MPFFYQTGEQIRKGDRVRLNDDPAEIEHFADPAEGPSDWYVTEFGGGVMVLEPKTFGRIFLTPADSDYACLELVSRGPE